MTLLADLITRRDAIGAELAALTSSAAGGLPDAASTGIGHVAYKDGLYRELEQIEKRIATMGGGGGNFEVRTRAISG